MFDINELTYLSNKAFETTAVVDTFSMFPTKVDTSRNNQGQWTMLYNYFNASFTFSSGEIRPTMATLVERAKRVLMFDSFGLTINTLTLILQKVN